MEQQDVVGIEHPADRACVLDMRRHIAQTQRRCFACELPSEQHAQQLGQQYDTNRKANRCIALEALTQGDEIDVQHHDDKQEQHRHRADIDDDQDHRQELGTGDQEQSRGVEERQYQKQHRMHRVAAGDHHRSRTE